MENLRPWDGKHGRYQHDAGQVAYWNMQISDDGTIWYLTHAEQPQLSVWCPASMLRAHLHHLEQIEAR